MSAVRCRRTFNKVGSKNGWWHSSETPSVLLVSNSEAIQSPMTALMLDCGSCNCSMSVVSSKGSQSAIILTASEPVCSRLRSSEYRKPQYATNSSRAPKFACMSCRLDESPSTSMASWANPRSIDASR
ncbi:hypothetical protein OGATHE_006417 [Ogataea polymorpha]|uniref:Uncharacterized protein n=1 Tax=Ogataea polymorpha TaxID=460523 RepID=A0A9P8NR35_9ASCO|nr:hypothetical protein OGATHE_006417 [Ogataea polymorpha]